MNRLPKNPPAVWRYYLTDRALHPAWSKSLDGNFRIMDGSPIIDMIEEPIPYCFTFPLFSAEYCKFLIDLSDREKRVAWERNIGDPYTAIEKKLIHVSPSVYRQHREFILGRMINGILYGLFNQYQLDKVVNAFFIRYSPDTINKMEPHYDEESLISLSINLSSGFEGGGISFARYPHEVIVGRQGWAVMFPGNPMMMHQGHPVTEGERRVLVYWLK